MLDYFYTNIMQDFEPYEDYKEPTIEEIEARNREIELMQDPFEEVYTYEVRKAGYEVRKAG